MIQTFQSIKKLIAFATVGLLAALLCPALAFATPMESGAISEQGGSVATQASNNIWFAKVSEIAGQPYTGSAVTPVPTVKMGGKKLVEGVDFEMDYVNNVKVGNYTAIAIVRGIGDYKGAKKVKFSIVDGAILNVEKSGNDITFSQTGSGWSDVFVTGSSGYKTKDFVTGGTKSDPQVITFKPGKYTISRQMLKSYTTIIAKGATLRLYSTSSGGFYEGGQSSKGKGGYTHLTNVKIVGGKYLCKSNNKSGSMMKFSHAKNITLSNFSVNNCYGTHFIEFVGVANSKIDKVKLTGVYKGDSTNEAIQLDNALNASVAPSCEPFDGTTCKNVKVTNCTIKVPSIPFGIGTNYFCKKPASNITIENCDITAGINSINLRSSTNCTIKNCVSRGADIRRNDASAKNLKESGNTFVK